MNINEALKYARVDIDFHSHIWGIESMLNELNIHLNMDNDLFKAYNGPKRFKKLFSIHIFLSIDKLFNF